MPSTFVPCQYLQQQDGAKVALISIPAREALLQQTMFVTRSAPCQSFQSTTDGQPLLAWREFALVAQLPWFIATFENQVDGVCNRDTLCFSRATDLTSCIRSRSQSVLTDLICVLPPWRTGSTRWTTRSARAVWRGRSNGQEVFVFEDLYGADFFAHFLESREPPVENPQLIVSISE